MLRQRGPAATGRPCHQRRDASRHAARGRLQVIRQQPKIKDKVRKGKARFNFVARHLRQTIWPSFFQPISCKRETLIPAEAKLCNPIISQVNRSVDSIKVTHSGNLIAFHSFGFQSTMCGNERVVMLPGSYTTEKQLLSNAILYSRL